MYRTFKEIRNGQEVKLAVVKGRFTSNAPETKTVTAKGQQKQVLDDNDFKVAVNFIGRDREDIVVTQSNGKDVAYIKVKAWEKTAELLSKYAEKGQEVTLIGRPKKEVYNGKEYCSILVEEFEFGAKSHGKDSSSGQSTPSTPSTPSTQSTSTHEQHEIDPSEVQGTPADETATEINDNYIDDIPF